MMGDFRGVIMDKVSYTSFRANLANMLDKVNQDHKPLMITRQNGKSAIVMSVEDFRSYEETSYLMASPENARRLNESIARIEAGKSIKHKVEE